MMRERGRYDEEEGLLYKDTLRMLVQEVGTGVETNSTSEELVESREFATSNYIAEGKISVV